MQTYALELHMQHPPILVTVICQIQMTKNASANLSFPFVWTKVSTRSELDMFENQKIKSGFPFTDCFTVISGVYFKNTI